MNDLKDKTAGETAPKREKKLLKHKLSDTLPVLYLITLILIFLGQGLGVQLEFIPFLTSTDVGVTATLYFEFIGIWILAVLYMRFTKKNRPILRVIGHKETANNWINVLIGILIGFGLNGICILAAWLHKDISLSYASSSRFI